MSSQVQRMIGPVFKVVCETCGRYLVPASVKKHKEKVCMTMPHDEVNKDTTATTVVEKETVGEVEKEMTDEEVAPYTTTAGRAVPPATSEVSQDTAPGVLEEETTFTKGAKEHVKKTNEEMVEAGDDAEIYDVARIASQKARERSERAKQRMEPEMDWMAQTLHLDDWLTKVGPSLEVERDENEVETDDNDVGTEKEAVPEDAPLPETPRKGRKCHNCTHEFTYAADLMKHFVANHEVDTGETSPVLFLMAELMWNTQTEVQNLREENEKFRQQQLQMQKTMIQDMTEMVRKAVKNEMKEKAEVEETAEEDEVEVIEEDKAKPVKCDECEFETESKKKLVGHKKVKHGKGEYPCISGNCRKWFKTKQDLDQHKTQLHGQKFSCTKCTLTFSKKEGLEHHARVDHKPAQAQAQAQAKPKKIECGECGITGVSEEQMNQHMVRVHGQGFQPVKARQCRYIKTRRGCDKGDACPFSHGERGGAPSGEVQERKEECRHGRQCTYLQRPQGCKFRHSELGSRQPLPRHQQQQHREQPARRRIRCDDRLEDCPKVPSCPFVHSMEEFPTLRAAQAPRACRYQEDCNRVPNCPFGHYNGGFHQIRSNQMRN